MIKRDVMGWSCDGQNVTRRSIEKGCTFSLNKRATGLTRKGESIGELLLLKKGRKGRNETNKRLAKRK